MHLQFTPGLGRQHADGLREVTAKNGRLPSAARWAWSRRRTWGLVQGDADGMRAHLVHRSPGAGEQRPGPVIAPPPGPSAAHEPVPAVLDRRAAVPLHRSVEAWVMVVSFTIAAPHLRAAPRGRPHPCYEPHRPDPTPPPGSSRRTPRGRRSSGVCPPRGFVATAPTSSGAPSADEPSTQVDREDPDQRWRASNHRARGCGSGGPRSCGPGRSAGPITVRGVVDRRRRGAHRSTTERLPAAGPGGSARGTAPGPRDPGSCGRPRQAFAGGRLLRPQVFR